MSNTLGCYRRVSSTIQMTEGDSLSTQLEIGRGVFKRLKKTKVVSKFKDYNEGAKSSSKDDFTNRPILNKLLLDIEEGKIKHLFVYDTDRLSRNENTWFVIRQRIKENNVKLYTRTGELDLNDPTDAFLTGILGFVNQYTNEQRKIRSQIGRENRIRQGQFTGGAPNFGYATVNKRYAINKEESRWVKKMFNLVEKGGSIKDVKTLFDTNGVKPRRSKLWNIATIQSMVQNRIYIGDHAWKGIKVSTPPIIMQSQFDRVQKLYGKERWRNHYQVNEYLLTPLLECGHCGSKLNGQINKARGSKLYICPAKQNSWRGSKVKQCTSSKNINITRTDGMVWETILTTVGSSNYMKEKFKKDILMQKETRTNTFDGEIKGLDKQIKIKRALLGQTLDSISVLEVERLQERMEIEVYQLTKDRLVQERDEIRRTILGLEDDISIKNQEKKWIDWIGRYGLDMDKRESYSFKEKKEYCKQVVDKIVVKQTEDKKGHSLDIKFSQPIVNDRLKYNDPKDKRKGYEVLTGKKNKDVYLESVVGRPKKKDLSKTHMSSLFNSNGLS